ncbi:MAG: DUF354 domain-containing protein [Candidatus Hodarchaeota archaeon]
MTLSSRTKIWIDLDNSPHVPFFTPIIQELNRRGFHIILTARDCFQVCGLADLFNLHYQRIGRHYGKNKMLKVIGLLYRALQMVPLILSEKPDLAISHGSRSQLLLASVIRIPTVIIMDYEYAKLLPFISPTWLIAPEIIPHNAINHDKKRIIRYSGTKEDVYLPDFKPNPDILHQLGISERDLVVTIRPPATEAHYHNFESDKLFYFVVEFLGRNFDVRMVVLPRNEKKQTALVKNKWPDWYSSGKIIIPDHAVDGLSLIWHSDLVISGGGTMNREAAALGVPVYSIFRGKIGAVDKYLARSGRLVLLENINDVRTKIVLRRRHRAAKPPNKNCSVLHKIIDEIISILHQSQHIQKVNSEFPY